MYDSWQDCHCLLSGGVRVLTLLLRCGGGSMWMCLSQGSPLGSGLLAISCRSVMETHACPQPHPATWLRRRMSERDILMRAAERFLRLVPVQIRERGQ